MKILSVFGTRPEAIKMAPLLQALQQEPAIESVVAVTAQHREMLDQVLELFNIRPNYDLDLMRHRQTLEDITAAVLHGLRPIIAEEKPNLLLVHGDTTTTMAAALAAFYQGIPCGHVEAGLRSGQKFAPFPEEINRRITGVLADIHFAPTQLAADNLHNEGLHNAAIFITGNTVIDALLQSVEKPCSLDGLGLDKVDWGKEIILLTCHRRENWGAPMRQIFAAVNDILTRYPQTELIFPLHKNPVVREIAYSKLSDNKQVHFCEPLDYLPFCHVMKRCRLILTDSGGLQEEGPALGKPVLVLRTATERPEAIEAGTAMLAGNSYDSVFQATDLLLTNQAFYERMAHAVNPYGDGHATEKIMEIIRAL
jgi:UDP-N-acetylglucosamine 2-epimerase (non-hydrolysing)